MKNSSESPVSEANEAQYAEYREAMWQLGEGAWKTVQKFCCRERELISLQQDLHERMLNVVESALEESIGDFESEGPIVIGEATARELREAHRCIEEKEDQLADLNVAIDETLQRNITAISKKYPTVDMFEAIADKKSEMIDQIKVGMMFSSLDD